MNVMGVQYPGNNLPEANTRNLRAFVRTKEEQDDQLEWLQHMYETYSRHLRNFDNKLKDPSNNDNHELVELHIDCLEKLNEIKRKINELTSK